MTAGLAQAAVCFESTSHVYATMDTFRLGPIGFGASEQCARPGSPASAVDLHLLSPPPRHPPPTHTTKKAEGGTPPRHARSYFSALLSGSNMLTTALVARPMLRLLGWVMMIQRHKHPPAKTQSAERKALNSPKYARSTRLSIAHLVITRVATALSFFPQAALRLRAWLVAGGAGLCGAVTELSATAGATLAEGRTVLRGQVCADDALVRTCTLCDSTYVRSSSDSA
eukprot:COSAG01_NODE_5750_length_4058_cov_1.778030_2_plen_227_part_00